MSGRLLVSVVIPTYNRAGLVVRAVRSALAACEDGDEVIVVDDGSTDETADRLEAYRERIVYLYVANGGAGRARNLGVAAARAPLVAFLDSDDLWIPGTLDLKRRLLAARPDLVFAFSDFAACDPAGRVQHGYLARWHEDPRSWDEILGPGVPLSSVTRLEPQEPDGLVHIGDLYLAELAANYVFTSTLVVRRDRAGDALRFADDLPIHEDWECFGRLARAGPAAYLARETAWQWDHDGGRLSGADTVRSATARIAVLERVWGADPGFLARYRDRYEEVLAGQHVRKARGLIRDGSTRQAREELRMAGRAPLSHRALAALPGPVARWLVAARRAL